MHGELQPTIYRFKLGGFEVTPIMDSKVIRPGLTPSFGGEAAAEEVKALAKANRIDTNRYLHPFTPILVNTGKELVLFDTGNGSLADEYEQLKGRLPPGHSPRAWRRPATSRRTSTSWSSRTATPTISAG